METVTQKTGQVHPDNGELRYDAEKGPKVTMTSGGDAGSESDEFQDGVRRVRAITTIWSKSTLCSMFAL